MTESPDRTEDRQEQQPDGTSPGEYVVGALGALLVLLLVGFLGYQAIVARETGPELSVAVTGVELAPAGYAVHFELVNSGGETAEAVQLGGALVRRGRPVEQASTTVDYVPPDSVRAGALLFSIDPRTAQLQIRPTG